MITSCTWSAPGIFRHQPGACLLKEHLLPRIRILIANLAIWAWILAWCNAMNIAQSFQLECELFLSQNTIFSPWAQNVTKLILGLDMSSALQIVYTSEESAWTGQKCRGSPSIDMWIFWQPLFSRWASLQACKEGFLEKANLQFIMCHWEIELGYTGPPRRCTILSLPCCTEVLRNSRNAARRSWGCRIHDKRLGRSPQSRRNSLKSFFWLSRLGICSSDQVFCFP